MNKVQIIPCGCGSPVCKRHHISLGIFYQGSGWGPELAQLIADLLNENPERLDKALKADGGDA